MNDAGQIGCYHDAIDVRLHSAEIVAAVEAHNELLHDAKAERDAYEAALRVPEPGEDDPETITVIDEEGEEQEVPNPVHVAWTEAQAVISGLSQEVRDWIDADQPEPEPDTDEHDTWAASVLARDAAFIDTAPDFEVVTDSPLLRPIKAWAFWAVVDMTEGLRDTVYAAIDAIPDPVQKAATKARFERTEEYRGFDPLFVTMRQAVGMTDAQFLTLWTTGLAIQDAA